MNLNVKLACLLILLCLLTHVQTIQSEILFDDHVFTFKHVQAHFTSFKDFFTKHDARHYNPVYYLVNILLFRYFGDSPATLHSIAIAIFLSASLSVYWLINLITQDKPTAFFTSALFIVHPILLVNVHMVAQNFIFLNLSFNVLSLGFFLKSYSQNKINYVHSGLSFLFFMLGLLTFEISALLFAYIFLISFFVLGKGVRESLFHCLPYLALAIIFAAFYLLSSVDHPIQEAIGALGLTWSTVVASAVVLHNWYVGNLLFPLDYVFMKNIHPVADQTALYIGLLIFYVLALGRLLIVVWRRTLKSMALIWLLVGFPFSALAMFSHYYMGLVIEPHWLTFPSIGFFLLLALMAKDLKKTKAARYGLAALVLALTLYFLESQRHHTILQKERTYATYWEKMSPNNFLALMSLAMNHLRADERNEAAYFAHKAYQASAYDPYRANLTLGNFYLDMKDSELAKTYLMKAIEQDPRHPAAYLSYAVVLKRLGRADEAQQYLQKGIALRGNKFRGLGPN